jgi:ABC-2 type transport system permease protein
MTPAYAREGPLAKVRQVADGGAFAYRALFNWAKPSMYIPTMLGGSFFQVIAFTMFGEFSGARSARFFLVGNAVQVCALSCMYGMGMMIANERRFGTLGPVLATPASRALIFLSRTWPIIVSGLFVSLFALGSGMAATGVRLPAGSVLPIVAVMAISVLSCTAFGFLLGSLCLYTRDILFFGNIVYPLMLLLCGVEVPRDVLPYWLRVIGAGLPLTHGVAAAQRLAQGASSSPVAGLVGEEALVGACYAVSGYGLLLLLEVLSRRRNALERM